MLEEVRKLVSHMSMSCLGVAFRMEAHIDKEYGGRIYLQVFYTAPCTKTKIVLEWSSGKNYLSRHMTEDEVVKKAYVTFKQCIEHEIMEGFKFDNTIVFNPHVNFRELLTISDKEVKREKHDNP